MDEGSVWAFIDGRNSRAACASPVGSPEASFTPPVPVGVGTSSALSNLKPPPLKIFHHLLYHKVNRTKVPLHYPGLYNPIAHAINKTIQRVDSGGLDYLKRNNLGTALLSSTMPGVRPNAFLQWLMFSMPNSSSEGPKKYLSPLGPNEQNLTCLGHSFNFSCVLRCYQMRLFSSHVCLITKACDAVNDPMLDQTQRCTRLRQLHLFIFVFNFILSVQLSYQPKPKQSNRQKVK